jgi:hypothetical protein
MASDPPPDLSLEPINGAARTVRQWLTSFHLLVIVLDPYTNESSWVLAVAERIMHTFEEADCRVSWLVAAGKDDCRRFLGPRADEVLTFADPDRLAIKAFGLERLPAIIHLGIDGTVVNAAEGWAAPAWQRVVDHLAKIMSWSAPVLGLAKDPGPFPGTPALG